MGTWIGVAALVAVLWWLFVPRRQRAAPAPEDDVTTPIDREELEEAERELEQDPRPRSLEQGLDDDEDDWGPGTR
jgi:hypothetical protein